MLFKEFENNNSFFTNNKSLFGNNNIINQDKSLFSQKENNSIFGNNSNTRTLSLFDNNKIDNNNNNLFNTNSNTNSLFNDKNIQKSNFYGFKNNYKQFDYSLGHKFYGTRFYDCKFMSISSKEGYDHASQEELRLADYEKYQTGKVNKYKILSTKNNIGFKNFKEDIKDNNGLFINNNFNQGKTLFDNNNNFNGEIIGNSKINQGNIFENNNNNKQFRTLFDKNNNDTTKSLFWNNDNNKEKKLFDNNTNNQTAGLSDNNRLNLGKLFNNDNNQIPSLFGNKGNSILNDNNNNKFLSLFENKGNSILNDNNNKFASLFENKGTLFLNSTDNNNSLFNNNNQNNNTNIKSNTLFSENKMNLNQENNTPEFTKTLLGDKINFGTINNKPLNVFGKDNMQLNNKNNILFIKNDSNNSEFTFPENKINYNLEDNNANNNLNHDINNNKINNYYNDIFISNEIINPLKYQPTHDTMELSPKDEILSNIISETIRKKKSIDEFLEELEQNYNSKENNNNNDDILENYGSYLENSNVYNKYEKENYLLNENYKNTKITKERKIIEKSNRIYNEEEIYNSLSKLNKIYEEYERCKKNYKRNSHKNLNLIQNNDKQLNKTINVDESKLMNNNNNCFLGRNDSLFQKNIVEMDKLNNNIISKNIENNKEKRQIQINNNNKSEKQKQSQNDNLIKCHDITIKFNLPEKDESHSSGENENILILEKLDLSKKINLLIDEIKSKILDILKNSGLENLYSIEKISLYISNNIISETNSLQDYDLTSNNYSVQAFIIYTSLIKNKDNNNKEDELVPLELIPKLTKEGYKCCPSIMELSRKTKDELTKIEGFKIYNKYGEIVFEEPINLLAINLDQEIIIEKDLIETGDELDYCSIFKLYNFKIDENGLSKYKEYLEKVGGKLVEYKNNEIVWEYKTNDRV